MKVGDKVAVVPDRLFAKHPALRFEVGPSAIDSFAPRGASGEVVRVNEAGTEAMVEIYWNDNPAGNPGVGKFWRCWVKREWFGQLLRA